MVEEKEVGFGLDLTSLVSQIQKEMQRKTQKDRMFIVSCGKTAKNFPFLSIVDTLVFSLNEKIGKELPMTIFIKMETSIDEDTEKETNIGGLIFYHHPSGKWAFEPSRISFALIELEKIYEVTNLVLSFS